MKTNNEHRNFGKSGNDYRNFSADTRHNSVLEAASKKGIDGNNALKQSARNNYFNSPVAVAESGIKDEIFYKLNQPNSFLPKPQGTKTYQELIRKVMSKHYGMIDLYSQQSISFREASLKSIYFIDNNKSIVRELDSVIAEYIKRNNPDNPEKEAIKMAVNRAIFNFYIRCNPTKTNRFCASE